MINKSAARNKQIVENIQMGLDIRNDFLRRSPVAISPCIRIKTRNRIAIVNKDIIYNMVWVEDGGIITKSITPIIPPMTPDNNPSNIAISPFGHPINVPVKPPTNILSKVVPKKLSDMITVRRLPIPKPTDIPTAIAVIMPVILLN